MLSPTSAIVIDKRAISDSKKKKIAIKNKIGVIGVLTKRFCYSKKVKKKDLARFTMFVEQTSQRPPYYLDEK